MTIKLSRLNKEEKSSYLYECKFTSVKLKDQDILVTELSLDGNVKMYLKNKDKEEK